MRTVKKPEIRRQEILSGALTVFLKKGYEKTTIGDIAQELGISQGLCYRYYDSKEMIYDAVLDTYAGLIVDENLRSRRENQTIRQWVEQIPDLLGIMERAEHAHPQLYSLLHDPQNQQMHRELCLKVGEKMIPAVTALLAQARDQGEIQIPDCRQTAIFGIYGEIGLLLSHGLDCTGAIQENWRRLLGL